MQKHALLRKYKFYLAFENSIAVDYVSERYYQGLASGAGVVYRGAPNVNEFYPAEGSVINVWEFKTTADLAAELKRLDGDDAAYDHMFDWKRRSPSTWRDSFRKTIHLLDIHSRCRLCRKVAHGCNSNCDCGGRVRTP